MNKPDIQTSEDVVKLVDSFYEKVRKHKELGYIFDEVVKFNWDQHLPKMYAFWESILFQKSDYKGNPMEAHRNVHEKYPLTKELFNAWLDLFRDTLDELFEGPRTEKAYQRALSIATVTQIKLNSSHNIY